MNGTHRDDVVLWVVISFCLLTPVVLTTLWAYSDKFYPPMLLSVLLGIGIAALTYRYLGGTSGSEFSVGVLKVAGSAALLLGTAYLTNEGLSKQMDAENSSNRLAEALKSKDAAIRAQASVALELEEAKSDLEKLRRDTSEVLIREIEKLTPKSPLGISLVDMARKRRGPFSEVARVLQIKVTVAGYVKGNGKFYACEDLELRDEAVRITRINSNEAEQPSSIHGEQAGLISAAICTNKDRGFDIQIGCRDGAKLLPDQIAGCDKNGSVRWRERNGPKTFLLSAEVMSSAFDRPQA